jgi:hypothetical protein
MVKPTKLITYGLIITAAIAGVYGLKIMLNPGIQESPTTWGDDSTQSTIIGGKRKMKRNTKKKILLPKNKTMKQ